MEVQRCTGGLELNKEGRKSISGRESGDKSSVPNKSPSGTPVLMSTMDTREASSISVCNDSTPKNSLPMETIPSISLKSAVAANSPESGQEEGTVMCGVGVSGSEQVAPGVNDNPEVSSVLSASATCSEPQTITASATPVTCDDSESTTTSVSSVCLDDNSKTNRPSATPASRNNSEANKSATTVSCNSSESNKSATTVSSNSSEANTSSVPNYEFDGESYCYTDKESGITYKFDNNKQEWIIKETFQKSDKLTGASNESEDEDDDIDEDGNKNRSKFVKQDMSSGVYSFEGDTHVYTDPTDGTKYMWDREKNAWFPKIDEDFLARYQMSYGFVGNAPKDPEPEDPKKVETSVENVELKRKAPTQPTWFDIDEEHNNKVYVSNLPEDTTEQEFIDVMQKCGLIMKDPDTGKLKIKLYTVPGSTQLKGDGLCTYIRIESVDLALKVLDGYEIRGHKLSVDRAKFQMKGDFNPSLKPKKRKKKDKEKLKKIQDKLLDWRPDMLRGERPKNERVVVLKNLFEPCLFEKNVSLLLEYQQDLREECSKFGVVRKVVIHDRHAEGVAQVFFSDPEEADICVKFLNGRWYSQRQLKAETWDGKTKYRIIETEEQTKERLEKWNSFLEKGEQSLGKEEK